MTTMLPASNFSCPRCRDLTSNLMKSVDAFEILMTVNVGITAEILISTIRKIVMSSVTTTEIEATENLDDRNQQKDSQAENQANFNSSLDIDVNSAPAFAVTRDLSEAENLDLEINNSEKQQENLPNVQFESGSNLPPHYKTGKRKRPGRPKRDQNNRVTSKALSKPRTSGRRRKTLICTNPALKPEEEKAETGSQKPGSHSRGRTSNRPIATDQDFKRAAEYVKRLKVDTPDGLYYHLSECTQCFRQFPNFNGNYNARVHVVGVHFNKRIMRKSSKPKTEIQLGPDEIKSSGRPMKVQLLSNRQKNRGLRTNLSRSRIININSTSQKPEIPSRIDNSEIPRGSGQKARKNIRLAPMSGSIFSGYPNSSSAPVSSSPFPIPPNLTVRNPCANFDLERTLNVRVAVNLIQNLANIRRVPSSGQGQGQSQSTTARTKIEDADINNENDHTTEIKRTDLNKPAENRVQALEIEPPVDSQCGQNSVRELSEDDVNSSSQLLSDVLSDLIEMDVDTIMKMQL